MSHETTVELLSRYLDGDLGSSERRRAEALLEEDERAREIYEGLRTVRASLSQMADGSPPPHLGVLVQRRVALEAEETGLWQRVDVRLRRFLVEPGLLPAFAVVLSLAAMVYVLAIGVDRFERGREPVILRPSPSAVGTAPAPRELSGRTFEFQGDRWIERGISGETAAVAPRVDIAADQVEGWIASNPELTEVPELGAVVLELEGEVVEIVFERHDR